MKRKAVFCSECKYLGYTGSECKHTCIYCENVVIKRQWYNKYETYTREPYVINKNNNCKWFEKRSIEVPEWHLKKK